MIACIVIPCFNERDNILVLLNEYQEAKNKLSSELTIKLVLVNNGSTDGTEKIEKTGSRELLDGVTFLHLVNNIGYGGGIIAGLRSLANFDYAGWTHADNQTSITDVLNSLLEFIYSDKQVFIPYRKSRGAQRLQTAIFDRCISSVVGVALHDINAQPKLFKKGTFDRLLLHAPDDFALDIFFSYVLMKEEWSFLRREIAFSVRRFGDAKGGNGALISRFKLLLMMIKSARGMLKRYENIQA